MIHIHDNVAYRGPVKRRAKLPVEDRLIRRMAVHPLGCWLWTGAVNKHGYGSMRDAEGRNRMVHRLAYEEWVGPIPEGLEIDHLCRTRNCFNPAHLEPVTHYVNAMRGKVGELKRRTHCSRGHALIPENQTSNGRGGYRCRQCNRDNTAAWLAARKETR